MKNNKKQYKDKKFASTIVFGLTNKSLVLSDTNLQSTVGINYTQNELNMVKLPYFITSVMVGLLLYDGHINF